MLLGELPVSMRGESLNGYSLDYLFIIDWVCITFSEVIGKKEWWVAGFDAASLHRAQFFALSILSHTYHRLVCQFEAGSRCVPFNSSIQALRRNMPGLSLSFGCFVGWGHCAGGQAEHSQRVLLNVNVLPRCVLKALTGVHAGKAELLFNLWHTGAGQGFQRGWSDFSRRSSATGCALLCVTLAWPVGGWRVCFFNTRYCFQLSVSFRTARSSATLRELLRRDCRSPSWLSESARVRSGLSLNLSLMLS